MIRVPHRRSKKKKKSEQIFENQIKEQKLGACLGIERGYVGELLRQWEKHSCKGLRINGYGEWENYKLFIIEWTAYEKQGIVGDMVGEIIREHILNL